MAYKSAIEWTDSTWNPVTGCTKVSEGCRNCYAERVTERFRNDPTGPFRNGFELTLHEHKLDQPMHWRDPRMIFVCSLSDLFHDEIPTSYVHQIFDRMEKADRHVYQVLTKRPARMNEFLRTRYGSFRDPLHLLDDGKRVPAHIWLGVSVESIDSRWRIFRLKEAPSESLFVSFEPLLGPLAIDGPRPIPLDGIAWAIVGGESGPKAREMKEEWVRPIQELCRRTGTEFFFKQWGGLRPKSNGALLDGRLWHGFPWHLMPPAIRARKQKQLSEHLS